MPGSALPATTASASSDTTSRAPSRQSFGDFDLGDFDVVVSSFAIHHLAPSRQRALYGEVFSLLRPGGRFVNAEHVASPTAELHEEFLSAIGRTKYDDDPSNQLVAVEQHLTWLNEIGFANSDCSWKWRELAVLSGTRP